MEHTQNEMTVFDTINEEIKRALSEIDALVFAHYPYFNNATAEENNHAFIALLDQLMELKCSVETIKQCVVSEIAKEK